MHTHWADSGPHTHRTWMPCEPAVEQHQITPAWLHEKGEEGEEEKEKRRRRRGKDHNNDINRFSVKNPNKSTNSARQPKFTD